MGTEFFLILGMEPLVIGDKLVDLVKWWKENDYYYALYSTSPRPLFDMWKDKLIDAGLKNWSGGVDFISPVYDEVKDKISAKARNLVEKSKDTLVKKADENLSGQKYMHEKGVGEILSLITISRMNIEFVPEMIAWLHDNMIKESTKWKIGFNFIEYAHQTDNDFAIEKGTEFDDYFFTEKDKPIWEEFVRKMEKLESKILEQQIPWSYIKNWDAIVNLNVPCTEKSAHIAIDSSGKFRKCGYCTGKYVNQYSIFDWPVKKKEIEEAWKKDLKGCTCYWALGHLLKENHDIVRFDSKFWSDKYENV